MHRIVRNAACQRAAGRLRVRYSSHR